MQNAGSFLLLSLGLFLVCAVVTALEEKRQKRLFLSGLRGWLDSLFEQIYSYLGLKIHLLVRHTIKLSWYYSLHSALRAVMTILVRTYDRLELVFMDNRERAKVLRAEKRSITKNNHLTAIGEHKASTALTPAQKKKLRAKKLESD